MGDCVCSMHIFCFWSFVREKASKGPLKLFTINEKKEGGYLFSGGLVLLSDCVCVVQLGLWVV